MCPPGTSTLLCSWPPVYGLRREPWRPRRVKPMQASVGRIRTAAIAPQLCASGARSSAIPLADTLHCQLTGGSVPRSRGLDWGRNLCNSFGNVIGSVRLPGDLHRGAVSWPFSEISLATEGAAGWGIHAAGTPTPCERVSRPRRLLLHPKPGCLSDAKNRKTSS